MDAAGNASQASTSTDNTVTYDVTPPTVTINQAAGQADPTNAGPIHFTVVFSEPVTGFASADVTAGRDGSGHALGHGHAGERDDLRRGRQRHDRQRHGDGHRCRPARRWTRRGTRAKRPRARTIRSTYSAEARSSISGFVYVDVRNNGVKDPTDTGLPNVPVTISGPVTRTVFTGPDGDYHFDNLPAGTYTLVETQPLAFRDGQDTIGTPASGRAENDRFVDVEITAATDLVNYNFGERGLRADLIGLELLYASTPSPGQLLQQLDIVGDEGWFNLPTPGRRHLDDRPAPRLASGDRTVHRRLDAGGLGCRPDGC